MPIDFTTMFDTDCNIEIAKRNAGNVFYVPSKIYGMAVCEKEGVSLFGIQLTREQAALIIVGSDILISIIFVFAIFRLKWYE